MHISVSSKLCPSLCVREAERGSWSGLRFEDALWNGLAGTLPSVSSHCLAPTQSHTEPPEGTQCIAMDKDKHSPTFRKSHTNMAPTKSNTGLPEEANVRSSTWHEHTKSLFFFRLGLFAFPYRENVGYDYCLPVALISSHCNSYVLTSAVFMLSLCLFVCESVWVYGCSYRYLSVCVLTSVFSPKRVQFFHTDMWCVVRWDGTPFVSTRQP